MSILIYSSVAVVLFQSYMVLLHNLVVADFFMTGCPSCCHPSLFTRVWDLTRAFLSTQRPIGNVMTETRNSQIYKGTHRGRIGELLEVKIESTDEGQVAEHPVTAAGILPVD